jgi:predicted glutamine amidotransferase
MGRLIGLMANRTDRVLDALVEERGAVGETPGNEAQAWGVGFYQGGEILHRKRPQGGDGAQWSDIVGGIRSDVVLVHLRRATVGDYRAENTHPFRMRQWLFAHRGTVHGFDAIRDALLEPMPDFLRRNLRGTTDSEHVFHAFLSFLHDRDGLDAPDVDDAVVLAALSSTISLIDRLTAEIGAPPAGLGMLLTNGRTMFAVRRGEPVHFVERALPSEGRGSGPFRYVLTVGTDTVPPPDYRALADGQALVIQRDLATSIDAL